MAFGTAHHCYEPLIVALDVLGRVVASIVAGILLITRLHYLLHLSCGADHRMVIYGFRINVILNKKPCHNICVLPDLFNNGICVLNGKFLDFLPGVRRIFIADVQKRLMAAQCGGDVLEYSIFAIDGAECPDKVILRHAVQCWVTLAFW